MRGKTCGGCNLRLQYKCGKLCNCCYKRENLRELQYTGAGNYATAVMRGKTCGGYNTNVVNYATAAMHGKACGGCRTSAGNYATGAMRGKNCDGCKRGNTRKLPMQTYGLFQEWEAHSCLDMFAQNCLDLGGCVLDISSHFFIDKLKLWLKRFTQSIHCFNFKIWDWRFDWSRSSKDPADPH